VLWCKRKLANILCVRACMCVRVCGKLAWITLSLMSPQKMKEIENFRNGMCVDMNRIVDKMCVYVCVES